MVGTIDQYPNSNHQNGKFTEGPPTATDVPAALLNNWQAELANVVEAGGDTPSAANENQLTLAIQSMVDNAAATPTAAEVSTSDGSNVQAHLDAQGAHPDAFHLKVRLDGHVDRMSLGKPGSTTTETDLSAAVQVVQFDDVDSVTTTSHSGAWEKQQQFGQWLLDNYNTSKHIIVRYRTDSSNCFWSKPIREALGLLGVDQARLFNVLTHAVIFSWVDAQGIRHARYATTGSKDNSGRSYVQIDYDGTTYRTEQHSALPLQHNATEMPSLAHYLANADANVTPYYDADGDGLRVRAVRRYDLPNYTRQFDPKRLYRWSIRIKNLSADSADMLGVIHQHSADGYQHVSTLKYDADPSLGRISSTLAADYSAGDSVLELVDGSNFPEINNAYCMRFELPNSFGNVPANYSDAWIRCSSRNGNQFTPEFYGGFETIPAGTTVIATRLGATYLYPTTATLGPGEEKMLWGYFGGSDVSLSGDSSIALMPDCIASLSLLLNYAGGTPDCVIYPDTLSIEAADNICVRRTSGELLAGSPVIGTGPYAEQVLSVQTTSENQRPEFITADRVDANQACGALPFRSGLIFNGYTLQSSRYVDFGGPFEAGELYSTNNTGGFVKVTSSAQTPYCRAINTRQLQVL